MSRITTQVVLLAAVPLAFLLLVLAVSLALGSRNAAIVASSQRDARVIADADRAILLIGQANKNVLKFERTGNRADAGAYEATKSDMQGALADLNASTAQDRATGPSARRLSASLSHGLGILDRFLAAARVRDTRALTRLDKSPEVRDFGAVVTARLNAFQSAQRAAASAANQQLRAQIGAYTIALFAISAVGVIVTLVLFVRFGLSITRRLNMLGLNARRLAEGEKAQAIGGHDEIAELDSVYRDMTKRIQSETARSEALQRALLPQRLPSFPGVRLDAAYTPAAGEANLGGDWYDVFKISDRRLGISIGDVAGHGLRAAAIMGGARASLRAFAYFNDSPAEVLARVNQMLCRNETGVLVTAFFATLDLMDGSLRYAFAGHPAPLVVRTGGGVEHLSGGGGFVLGVEPRMEYVTHQARLDVGSGLVLYTDGMVEGDGNYVGTPRLEEAVEDEYREASHNIARAIQQRVLRGMPPRDDSAVLFVGVTALGESALQSERVVWTIDAKSEKSTRRVKRALLWHLGELAGDGADLSLAELIVSEMLGNVARHTPGLAEVILEWTGDKATVRVFDEGPRFELPDAASIADPFAESGRGLFLIRSLSRDLSHEWTGSGNCISSVLPVRVSESATLAAALAG